MPDPLDPRDRFIRGVWESIPSELDAGWVAHAAARPLTDKPLGDEGAIIQRMLDAGVSPTDIARLTRITSYHIAFSMLYLLEDPYGAYDGDDVPDEDQISWGLYRLDPDTDEPVEPMPMLFESFLGADPETTEMRPRTNP